MLKDTQIIIAIALGIIGIVIYFYKLIKFVNRIDANSIMHQKDMQDFKSMYQKEMLEFKAMLFESDGKPKFIRSEYCTKNREEISAMIEKSFKLLKYELMEAIEGKTTKTTERIHEKIENVERKLKSIEDKI